MVIVGRESFPIPVVVVKEIVGKQPVFVASTPVFDIASQGETVEAAVAELKEAVELFLEEPGVPVQVRCDAVFTSTTNVDLPTRSSHIPGCPASVSA